MLIKALKGKTTGEYNEIGNQTDGDQFEATYTIEIGSVKIIEKSITPSDGSDAMEKSQIKALKSFLCRLPEFYDQFNDQLGVCDFFIISELSAHLNE